MSLTDLGLNLLESEGLDVLPPSYRESITKVYTSLPNQTAKHAEYDLITKTVVGYYEQVKGWMSEKLKKYCQYAWVGLYSPEIYSSGQRSKVLDVAKFYIVWTYIDDVLDASTNITDTMAICASTKQAISGPREPASNEDEVIPSLYALLSWFLPPTKGAIPSNPYSLIYQLFFSVKGAIFGPSKHTSNDADLAPELYQIVNEFFSDDNWDPELLSIAKSMFLKYVDHTMICRANEIEQRAMLPHEYYILRAFNVGVPLAHVLHWYTNPELDVRALQDEDVLDAVILSGYIIGVTLDLFNENLTRPNKTRFANIYHVTRTAYNLSHDDTIRKQAEELVQNEAIFWTKMRKISLKFPREARAIGECHSSTYRWILRAKMRYQQTK